MGTDAILNIDTYTYSSIQGTIESTNATLKIGRINDAFSLLRKYYDSIVINVYSNLYLKDKFSLVVEKINHWLKGRAKLPEYKIMSQYLRNRNACGLSPSFSFLMIGTSESETAVTTMRITISISMSC